MGLRQPDAFLTTEDEVTKRSDSLLRHVIGSTGFDSVYKEKDELYDVGVGKIARQEILFLNVESKDTTECTLLPALEPQSDLVVFVPRQAKHRYYLDHRENLFYIRTNRNAKNFQIVTTPGKRSLAENWKVFIPHRSDTRIEEVDLFRDFAVSWKSRRL